MIESIGDEIKFIDTKVSVMKDHQSEREDQYLLMPSMYSKDTDTHLYLSPESCNPEHVTRSIPTNIINRCRTNCSDRVKKDSLFKDTLVQYKAYLLKSGYKEEDIDRKFINFAIKKKRKKVLQNDCNKDKKKPPMRKY